jgi:hypothetical protein
MSKGYDYMGKAEWEEEACEASKPLVVVSDITGEQKEIILLRIIAESGGTCDSSESRWSWLNWFCGDETDRDESDTFNRCHEKGWLHTTHDSDTDHRVTTLTDAGRAALPTHPQTTR